MAGIIVSMDGNDYEMVTIMSIKQPTRTAFIEFRKTPMTAVPEVSLMLSAARDAGLPVVRYLVEERRGDVQCRGSRGETMLHMAAEGGDVELLEYLYTMETPLHDKDSDHATPLHYAGRQGNTDAVRFLLERGLELDAVDGHGETCLQIAARRGHYDLMELLIKKGAKYGARAGLELNEEQRNLSLLCEAFEGRLNSIRLLVEMASVADRQDAKGVTAIDNAWRCGHVSIAESLLSRGSYDKEAKLHAFCRVGYVRPITQLLSEGVDVNSKDDNGCTGLWIASAEGHLDVVKLLVVNGASMVVSNNGNSPLHLAVQGGKLKVASFLLEHVQDINVVNNFGQTALAVATINSHLEVVKLLVANGASMVSDKDGDTPLHLAARQGNVEVITYLLQHIEDINLVNTSGRTALTLASHFGHLDVVKVLFDQGASMKVVKDGETPLHMASRQGKSEVVSFLLPHIEDINVPNSYSLTALCLASYFGHLDVVKLLVENGATMAGDRDGDSPLLLAAQEGRVEVVSYLLQHVENLNAVNDFGRTAIALASYFGQLEVVKLLVANGASMIVDKNGDSPLQLASNEGRVDVVLFLLQHDKDIDV